MSVVGSVVELRPLRSVVKVRRRMARRLPRAVHETSVGLVVGLT